MSRIPLGQITEYREKYAPEILFPIARSEAREALGLGSALPFSGADLWNAWELSWLDDSGKPVVATATITVPADSRNIVESKSMKLYLGSLAMTRYASAAEVVAVLQNDLGSVTGGDVDVRLCTDGSRQAVGMLPGRCVDDLAFANSRDDVDPALLAATDDFVAESLHTHLLRSLCPVTGQPDFGSVMLRYEGPRITPGSFLEYVVSYRAHHDFHEACVERMFLDIKRECRAEKLTVYARYTRRGGIDINPFRSDFEADIPNTRLWRQ